MTRPFRNIVKCGLLVLILLVPLSGCAADPPPPWSVERAQVVAAEVDSIMNQQLDLWYPRVVDQEHGGFFSHYDHAWQPQGAQEKMIVTQARHIWTLSKVAEHDAARRDDYLAFARHGFEFLRDRMWDAEFGGFFTDVSREGVVIPARNGQINKGLYGNAFAIYGLAAYFGASGEQDALDLAIETFHWLDRGAWDSEFGGYYTNLDRGGAPTDGEGRRAKDYNSSLHILEALAELYRVWPDEVLRDRLERTFRIARDRVTTDRGYMKLYFSRDWIPISNEDSARSVQKAGLGLDHITFGHDIETAYLLIESAHALGFPEDSVLARARLMVEHSIKSGWDKKVGGIYDTGYYFTGRNSATIVDSGKVWWAQAEALHSILMMAGYFPEDPLDYHGLFNRQWEYIKEYLLDPVHGEWYEAGIDQEPNSVDSPKATIWKGNYHTIRALLGVKRMLAG